TDRDHEPSVWEYESRKYEVPRQHHRRPTTGNRTPINDRHYRSMTDTMERADTITLTLPDGSTRTVAYGTSPRDVVRTIGERLLRDAIAVEVDGQIQDLTTPLRSSGSFRVLTQKDP